jgi:hypothetical protein
VALIERRTHRKILNLDEVAQRCRGLAPADGSALSCTVISFDDITDYPALLRELQTIDILVRFLFPWGPNWPSSGES